MGVIVASMPKWAKSRPLLGGNDGAEREAFLADIRASLDVARRLNAMRMTVVTSFMDPKVPVNIQTFRVIGVMRRADDIVAPSGVTMVMKPLNRRINRPHVYMQTVSQGYTVARGGKARRWRSSPILAGLDAIKARGLKDYKVAGACATAAQNDALLTLAINDHVPSGDGVFFEAFRQLVATGYYTLKIGTTQEREFLPVSGEYHGAFPYS